MTQPQRTGTFTLKMSHGQFVLTDQTERPSVEQGGNPLLSVRPGIVRISTGIADGPVEITCALYAQRPPLQLDVDEYDTAVEFDLTIQEPALFAWIDDYTDIVLPDPGQYRGIAMVRGRDTAPHQRVLHDVLEFYAFRFWPTSSDQPMITLKHDDLSSGPPIDTTPPPEPSHNEKLLAADVAKMQEPPHSRQ